MTLDRNITTWAEIDLAAIRHNVKTLQRLARRNPFFIPGRKRIKHSQDVMAVIKADAYGHGMVPVAKTLRQCGIKNFAVSNVIEGRRLREAGIRGDILIFESTLSDTIPDIVRYGLIPTVCNIEFAEALNAYLAKRKIRRPVHIKVDTGMGRLGVWHRDAFDFVKRLNGLRHLILEGIYTHFPSADSHDDFTEEQITNLFDLVMKLDHAGMVIPKIHASNSAGLYEFPSSVLNVYRPGLMLFGLYPNAKAAAQLRLKPAMSVVSTVMFIKTIEKGRSISYGRTFIAPKKMTVATIPIGYQDGYSRLLSGRAHVLIKGKRCKILGRVTMDQIVVDVSGVKGLRLSERVVILGKQKAASVNAEKIAQWSDTINYEVVCSLGNHLPRIYK